MSSAYLIAILVPYVPSSNHATTAIMLNPPKIYGSTCATAPCEARIKFSMFPKISKPENGAYSFKLTIVFTTFGFMDILDSTVNCLNT